VIPLIHAPWTPEQVASLIAFQACPHFHPYTCHCGRSLVPTPEGWRCEGVDAACRAYRQSDAMWFAVSGAWRGATPAIPGE
jgi:hypothetical protein